MKNFTCNIQNVVAIRNGENYNPNSSIGRANLTILIESLVKALNADVELVVQNFYLSMLTVNDDDYYRGITCSPNEGRVFREVSRLVKSAHYERLDGIAAKDALYGISSVRSGPVFIGMCEQQTLFIQSIDYEGLYSGVDNIQVG